MGIGIGFSAGPVRVSKRSGHRSSIGLGAGPVSVYAGGGCKRRRRSPQRSYVVQQSVPYYPPAPYYPVYNQYPQAPQVPVPTMRNDMGTVGLVLSILGLFVPFLSLIAIPFSAVGVARVANNQADNTGSAVTGLLLGILGFFWILVLLSL